MMFSAAGFALAHPFLRVMDAERAHRLTIAALKRLPLAASVTDDAALRVSLCGLDFPNPLGLAPGFDKNAEVPDAMLALGFGFVEVGTVTPAPQAGNPRPRLFRLAEDRAVINRMGFNNDGADAVAARLAARAGRPGIVGVNIGANKDSADRIADYVAGVARLGALASYLTINVSSPNTPGLRGLQSRQELERLLGEVNGARAKLARRVPMFLKIAPDLADEELADVADCCAAGAVDAVVISNTTLARTNLISKKRGEQGGLSGRPLFHLATRQLAKFYLLTEGRLPLIGVGGIDDAETAWNKIAAGASLIQLYSALVYEGPGLIAGIRLGLGRKLRENGFKTLAEAVGSNAKALTQL